MSIAGFVRRLGVGILSAGGLVSQRFQQRLAKHPWFELKAVVGSPETRGKKLTDLLWKLDEKRPELPDLNVLDMESSNLFEELCEYGVDFVFSALPSAVAERVEAELASQGMPVLSNASTYRGVDGIPLVVADLNPHHLKHWNSTLFGAAACSTNCTVIPLALPLKPIWDMVGIDSIKANSEQALSGGGWKLLSQGEPPNPEIPGEAEKVVDELRHLFGRVKDFTISPTSLPIDMKCKRVNARDGHIVHAEVELGRSANKKEVIEWMTAWTDRPQHLNLPSAPESPLMIIEDSPNREFHLMAGGEATSEFDLRSGMSVVVGNIEVEGRVLRFSALSHNTIRGAAGGCMLLAELLHAEGMLRST
ncbi:MAG: hypothetical protein CMB49_04645 [Euryarchaeota archaeon]|nr:hypothetical protein [Euryarchaeota archaeon]